MSDFIFSTKNTEQNSMTKEIQSIYAEGKPTVKEYHGHWGSLGVSRNLYHGFDSYENPQFIAAVIGGPVLTFRDNSFLNDKDSYEGTKAILHRWQAGEISWDNDLNGPFVVLIVNKQTSEVSCITDLMSFIPVFSYEAPSNMTLSTHVDVLAKNTEQSNNLDEVSIADFILHGIVTYPYTTYTNIFQVAPASEHSILRKSTELNSTSYWLPLEENGYKSINEAAHDLRNSLQSYINKITSETTNIAQFISGGEDSRTLSGLLKNYPRDAYIFLDQMNREGNIAEKVAKKYGATFKLATRSKLHYLDILPSCSDLVGSGSQYHHAHTFGFHNTCNLDSYTAVFGGLLADALLKGSHIKKIRGSSRFSFLPDLRRFGYSAATPLKNVYIVPNTLSKLTKRRQSHLKYVGEFRKESAEEWFELWPSSMNSNIPNIHANRRLFCSYEPFMSMDVVKISAIVPQKWKLNRKLFHKAAKPFLKPSKWLFHGDGWLPYFPWTINTFVQFTTWFYRQVAKRTGLIKGNQGPWGEWNVVTNSKEWEQSLINYARGMHKVPNVFAEESIKGFLEKGRLPTQQYINLTQALYHIKSKD